MERIGVSPVGHTDDCVDQGFSGFSNKLNQRYVNECCNLNEVLCRK